MLGFLDPEDGGDVFHRNVGLHLKDCTGRYIPEDGTLHNHCCESLKSYIINITVACSSLSLLLTKYNLIIV
jgi:hypothetical protein